MLQEDRGNADTLGGEPKGPRVEMRERKRERRETQRGFKKETTKVSERRQAEKV